MVVGSGSEVGIKPTLPHSTIITPRHNVNNNELNALESSS